MKTILILPTVAVTSKVLLSPAWGPRLASEGIVAVVGAEITEDKTEGPIEVVGTIRTAPMHLVYVTGSNLVSVGVDATGTVRTTLDVVSTVPPLSVNVYAKTLYSVFVTRGSVVSIVSVETRVVRVPPPAQEATTADEVACLDDIKVNLIAKRLSKDVVKR